MITFVRLLGVLFVLMGVLRLCGVPLIFGFMKRTVFESMDESTQKYYLIFTGLGLIIGGVLWFVLISRAF